MKKYLLFLTLFSFCAGAPRPSTTMPFISSLPLKKLALELRASFERINHRDWKEPLRELEKAKQWDEAIEFMQEVIEQNPEDKDAYIFMNYLLMNLLGKEYYDDSKEESYRDLAKKYFNESYAKFSEDPEYLYITGKTAAMAEWFFGIDQEDYEAMIKKAHELEPDNSFYNEDYYNYLETVNPNNPELIAFAYLLLVDYFCIKEPFCTKGAVGEYLLEIKKGWAKGILSNVSEQYVDIH